MQFPVFNREEKHVVTVMFKMWQENNGIGAKEQIFHSDKYEGVKNSHTK